MNIDRITFTGADDSVKVGELLTKVLTLAENSGYPIELGILLSPTNFGSPRFPSKVWLKSLLDEVHAFEIKYGSLKENALTLSAHLCGDYCNQFLLGNNTAAKDMPNLWTIFQRVQLNTHGVPTLFNAADIVDNMSDDDFDNKEYIFQMEGVNDHIFQQIISTTLLNASPLFDGSHGTGVYPTTWPFAMYKSSMHGFAGGIGPDNTIKALDDISSSCGPSTDIWIDMETKVRSADNQRFDLDLITAVMEQLPLLGDTGTIEEVDL